MKYIVDKEKVIIQRALYKIIIPNDPSFDCTFCDIRKTVGVNLDGYVGLFIKSKLKTFSPWYGRILNVLVAHGNTNNLIADIYGLDVSEKLLLDLQKYGYQTGDCLKEVQNAKNEKITFFGK